LGADVAGCDTDEAALSATLDECRALGARTLGVAVDVGEADQMQGFAERVESELGPTFCLVNNAGVGVSGGFFATELLDWEWLLRVNLWGTIHGARAEDAARLSPTKVKEIAKISERIVTGML
jgi:NAD(P)-dependent dehydrogenase (short-subunit alcohol dehydrogenase family)